jgi:hypothetical protein
VKEGTIRGSLLVGAYLYCLKKHRTYNKKAILELANGYLNVAGFISYTKLGFNKDLSLYNKRCFYDYTSLPMSFDLTRISEETIVMRATDNERRIVNVDDDYSGIFVLGRAITQSILINNNLLMKAEMDYDKMNSEDNEMKPIEQEQFRSIIERLSGTSKKSHIAISKSIFIREIKSLIRDEVTSILESQRMSSAVMESKRTPSAKSTKKGGLRKKHTRKNRR